MHCASLFTTRQPLLYGAVQPSVLQGSAAVVGAAVLAFAEVDSVTLRVVVRTEVVGSGVEAVVGLGSVDALPPPPVNSGVV